MFFTIDFHFPGRNLGIWSGFVRASLREKADCSLAQSLMALMKMKNKSHSWSKHTQNQNYFWNRDSEQSWVTFMETKLAHFSPCKTWHQHRSIATLMAFPGPRLPPELSSGEGSYPGGTSSGEDFSSPQGLFGTKCNWVVRSGRCLVVNATLTLSSGIPPPR